MSSVPRSWQHGIRHAADPQLVRQILDPVKGTCSSISHGAGSHEGCENSWNRGCPSCATCDSRACSMMGSVVRDAGGQATAAIASRPAATVYSAVPLSHWRTSARACSLHAPHQSCCLQGAALVLWFRERGWILVCQFTQDTVQRLQLADPGCVEQLGMSERLRRGPHAASGCRRQHAGLCCMILCSMVSDATASITGMQQRMQPLPDCC